MSTLTELPDRETVKTLAKRLRQSLVAEGNFITHGEALELIARQYGFRDWNTLSARLGNQTRPKLRIGGRVRGEYLGQTFTGEIRSMSRLGEDGHLRLSIHFDEPVDVVEFDSFSALRQRVSSTVGPDGCSPQKTSQGVPHMKLVG